LQEAYTDALKSAGFKQTYSFYRLGSQPFVYKQKYFGIIEFIEGHSLPFTYFSEENRQNGLELLQTYHNTTKNIVEQFSSTLSTFHLFVKWQERLYQFKANLPFVRYYLKEPIIDEILSWANSSLARLQSNSFQNEPSVILHGDVAHHNFLKSKNGEIYLIDFDLISIGKENADLLQYANRILPALEWSLPQLLKYPLFHAKLQNPEFLWALIYPTDILREWNRIVRDRSILQPSKLLMVMDLTIRQFHLRQQFIKELKNMLK
jgi:hypothetical protein